jgi:hypothetical protein
VLRNREVAQERTTPPETALRQHRMMGLLSLNYTALEEEVRYAGRAQC